MTPEQGELEQLRFQRAADVYKAGQLAGRLERTPAGSVRFEYLPGYVGDPVASTLPVRPDPVEVAGGGLPTFFAGLLPEGHRLTVIRQATKTSPDDELTLLLAVGEDTPGDVQIAPAGAALVDRSPLIEGDPAHLDFQSLASAPDRHALPGVQAKASAAMINVPLRTATTQAILKIDPPDHPHLVVNEFAHLQAARSLKIPVAQAQLVHDSVGVPGLWVTRFDRQAGPESETRLAVEDGAQVMDLLPAAKYTVDSEDLVLALSGQTNAPLVSVRNLYLQFLFAWLSGNGDLHAKNVSVLQGADGRWAVAPVYDIPCTVLYRDFSMALPIQGRTTKLRRRHWDDFAAAIGLPTKAARSAQTLALTVAQSIDLAALPFEGSPLNGAERELRFRRGELGS